LNLYSKHKTYTKYSSAIDHNGFRPERALHTYVLGHLFKGDSE
jgi:hypothetical protein